MFPVVMYGQDMTKWVNHKRDSIIVNELVSSKNEMLYDTENGIIWTKKDTTFFTSRKDYENYKRTDFAKEFLFVYSKYEQECYKDSSLVDIYVDPNPRTQITLSVGYHEKRWVHKEPTFEGFIEYIKNIANGAE